MIFPSFFFFFLFFMIVIVYFEADFGHPSNLHTYKLNIFLSQKKKKKITYVGDMNIP